MNFVLILDDQALEISFSTMDLRLKHVFTAIVVGVTQVGKSYFVANLVKHNIECIAPSIQRIIWCYTEYQETLFNSVLEAVPSVEFHEGLMDDSTLDSGVRNLIILDDLLTEISNNKNITNLFIRGSHHRNTSVLVLMQNLYYPGKEIRTINLNSCYLFLFNNPRDQTSILNLAKQISPSNTKYVVDAYRQAVSRKFGYLFIDLKPNTSNDLRLRTGLIPGEEVAIFLPR